MVAVGAPEWLVFIALAVGNPRVDCIPFGEISSEMDRKEWRPTCISAVSTQLTKCCGIGELPNLLTQPTPSHHPCSRHLCRSVLSIALCSLCPPSPHLLHPSCRPRSLDPRLAGPCRWNPHLSLSSPWCLPGLHLLHTDGDHHPRLGHFSRVGVGRSTPPLHPRGHGRSNPKGGYSPLPLPMASLHRFHSTHHFSRHIFGSPIPDRHFSLRMGSLRLLRLIRVCDYSLFAFLG